MRRCIRASGLLLLWSVTITALAAAPSAAQTSLFEVEKGDVKLTQVNDDGGFVARGTFDAGTIPAEGAGVRLMWYPKKAAFRVGQVQGAQWDEGSIGPWSVAVGLTTMASGSGSVAMGMGVTAGGLGSTAMGFTTDASGEKSTALGFNTHASGETSTAMGFGSTASGFSSTAMGSATKASAAGSTALGDKSVASGLVSTAMGAGTAASGDFSTALGFETRASGKSSTAMGAATTATGSASVAMGTFATAVFDGSFVFGDRSTLSSREVVTDLEPNQFNVRARGGFVFNSGVNIGCVIPAGEGAINCTSSRLAKAGFADLDGEAVLAQLAAIPIQRWHFIGTEAAHVGPTAEDFHAAFGLGEGPTKISTLDANGIALRAVQALERRTAKLRELNAMLRSELATLRTQLEALAGRSARRPE